MGRVWIKKTMLRFVASVTKRRCCALWSS